MMAHPTHKRAPYRAARFVALPLLLTMVASCASNPPVRAGVTGAPLPAGTAIALIGTPTDEAPFAVKARQAVTQVLAEHGHAITDDAAARLDIGLTDRSAKTGIAVINGEALSPAKRRRFLQTCDLRTHRLTLTHYGAGSAVPITRAWSETHQCKGKLDDGGIADLARQAVAALANQAAPATTAAAPESALLIPLRQPPAAP